MKKIAFYISDHGFGHASRNIPIIRYILEESNNIKIYIKTGIKQGECFVLYNETDLDKHFILLNQTKLSLHIHYNMATIRTIRTDNISHKYHV